MTLIVTFHTYEGIIIASDSRQVNVCQAIEKINEKPIRETLFSGTFVNDYAQKTFLLPNNMGLSICGVLDKNGDMVSKAIEEIVNEDPDISILDLAGEIKIRVMERFGDLDICVLLSGYGEYEGKFRSLTIRIRSEKEGIELNIPDTPSPMFDGDDEIMCRLTSDQYCRSDEDSDVNTPTPEFPYHIYSLQDAVNFCQYAIRTTRETMRFRRQIVSVGGSIDILLIQKDTAEWISKKQLSADLYHGYDDAFF